MRPSLAKYAFLALAGVLCVPLAADELGSAQLLIAGTRLSISPVSQTVPFNTATLVETRLEGFDSSLGTLPSGLRVLADFTGPEITGILTLETVPNEPFRIPRLAESEARQ